jgi:hypothetical protein
MVLVAESPVGMVKQFGAVVDFLTYYSMELGVKKCAYSTNDRDIAILEVGGRCSPGWNFDMHISIWGCGW